MTTIMRLSFQNQQQNLTAISDKSICLSIPNIPARLHRSIIRIIPRIHLVLAEKKHYSILYRKSEIVSIGWNELNKTSPMAGRFHYSYDRIHSELAALTKARNKSIQGCKMVNLRLSKLGKLNISKPCKRCEELLKYFGIREVIYSDERGEFKGLSL